jgi:hypothetical protein
MEDDEEPELDTFTSHDWTSDRDSFGALAIVSVTESTTVWFRKLISSPNFSMKAGSKILESIWDSPVAEDVIVSLEVLTGIGEFTGLDDSQLPGQVSISSSSNNLDSEGSLFS